MALKKRQVITWTNADPVYQRIYAALGKDELRISECLIWYQEWLSKTYILAVSASEVANKETNFKHYKPSACWQYICHIKTQLLHQGQSCCIRPPLLLISKHCCIMSTTTAASGVFMTPVMIRISSNLISREHMYKMSNLLSKEIGVQVCMYKDTGVTDTRGPFYLVTNMD